MTLPPPSVLIGIPKLTGWFPGQQDLFRTCISWFHDTPRFIGVAAATGCHAAGQGILMFDGTIKIVEDIQVGDVLMGPDSLGRVVTDLVRGSGKMYRITPIKGDPFTVNEDHVLTLVRTNQGVNTRNTKQNGKVSDITVRDYLPRARWFKHLRKLFFVPVDFISTASLPLDPYFLGVMLGNGSLTQALVGVTTRDSEVVKVVYDTAHQFGLRVRLGHTDAVAPTYYIHGDKGKHNNTVLDILRGLHLNPISGDERFIPHSYKVSSRHNRLEMLAGLIDTDGDGQRDKPGIAFISKSERLIDDFCFMARSVGLRATKARLNGDRRFPDQPDKVYDGRNYFRVTLSGDLSVLPCRVPRKQAAPRRQKKNHQRTGFSVEYVGVDRFYGFSLVGDPHYLLSDFTVTHNSGKTAISLLTARLSGARTVILTATKGLQQQYLDDAKYVGGVVVVGQNNFSCALVPSLRADEGPCHDGMPCSLKQSMCQYHIQLRKALSAKIVVTNYAYYLAQTNFSQGLGDIGLLILDEGHQAFGAMESFLTIYLSRLEVESMGISFPSSDKTDITQWSVWQSWANLSHPIAQEVVANIEADLKEARSSGGQVPGHISRSYRSAKAVVARLERLAHVEKDWVIERTTHGYRFTPKWVAQYSDLLFGKVPKVMLMSAILSRKTADSLGVPQAPDCAWVDAESYFPPENTPIWHIPTARINFRTDDFGSTVWVSRIDQIIQRRLDRKGIIFTVSYERARMIMQRSRFANIMLTHSTNDVIYVVNKFKKMPAPAVLVSPTVTTGWDFPAQETNCRYLIVGKVPYPDTTSPVLKARHEDDKEWSSFLAMETLIQECGRASRSVTDKCEIFCVDDAIRWFWYTYRSFAPKWFQARYKGSLICVPDALFPIETDAVSVVAGDDEGY